MNKRKSKISKWTQTLHIFLLLKELAKEGGITNHLPFLFLFHNLSTASLEPENNKTGNNSSLKLINIYMRHTLHCATLLFRKWATVKVSTALSHLRAKANLKKGNHRTTLPEIGPAAQCSDTTYMYKLCNAVFSLKGWEKYIIGSPYHFVTMNTIQVLISIKNEILYWELGN